MALSDASPDRESRRGVCSVLSEQDKFDEAIVCFDAALSVRPQPLPPPLHFAPRWRACLARAP